MPRALRPWESIWASVLAMLPSSSSVPTAMSSRTRMTTCGNARPCYHRSGQGLTWIRSMLVHGGLVTRPSTSRAASAASSSPSIGPQPGMPGGKHGAAVLVGQDGGLKGADLPGDADDLLLVHAHHRAGGWAGGTRRVGGGHGLHGLAGHLAQALAGDHGPRAAAGRPPG